MSAQHAGDRPDIYAPLVEVDGDDVYLRASRCDSCGRTEFPRLSRCPACFADAAAIRIGPDCLTAGTTEVLHAPPGGAVPVPYTVVAAAFDGGLSVLGTLCGHLHHAADDPPALGARLRTCVRELPSGTTYAFRQVTA
jgi:uncharacterized OB-fold protein